MAQDVIRLDDLVGKTFTNRFTQRQATVLSATGGHTWSRVRLRYQGSGRITTKQMHYFLYDFGLWTSGQQPRITETPVGTARA